MLDAFNSGDGCLLLFATAACCSCCWPSYPLSNVSMEGACGGGLEEGH